MIKVVKLPNGNYQVIENSSGQTGEIFDSIEKVQENFNIKINEGSGTSEKIEILESING